MLKALFSNNIRFQRCYLLLMVLGLSFGAIAQKEVEKAKRYLNTNAAQYRLSDKDIAEMGISSAYLSPTTGWYHVYFVQKHQSIEVYNGILNATLVNESIANIGNNFVPDIASKVPASIGFIPLTPVDAIGKAASSLKLPGNATNSQEISVNKLANGQIEKAAYTNADLSGENINVKLYWFPYDTLVGQIGVTKVNLVWNVQIYTKDQKNNWSVQVDALTGNIIETKDLIIHCDFGIPDRNHTHDASIQHEPTDQARQNISMPQHFSVVANSYKVFDYPIESPNHGPLTSVVSPYTKFLAAGKGPGVTNGWHDDGVITYTITRGNNVFAKEDKDANNSGGYSPNSATLDFNYTYTHSTGTANANLDAAITNLFYWNNLIHDVLYKYGFDEPSGNFQNTNLTATGLGTDFVNAEAQDGSGTNNANFNTPVDGFSPRMQMYLWSQGNHPPYQPDSDFDNGVISHEYGHGWSNRLTGGPAMATCLQNAEQAGEGWSDFLGLMLTTNWSSLTPTLASANIPRGMATYSMAKATSGPGLRPFRYSYDMAHINPLVTYGKVADAAKFSQPHGIGSIWATMLWDMAWEIILQDNEIVNNIYTVPAIVTDMKGNIAALKLVNEGLRLQPCGPSFIDARDAILKADSILFNKRYKCAIWKAFARRGLGLFATTGASKNDRIVTEDFTPFTDRVLTSAKTATICSGSAFNYTATSSVGGTTFAWNRPVIAGISNAVGNGNTATINETLINTTTEPIVVVYYFTLTPGNCPIKQEIWVTVNPAPVASVGTYSICKDGAVPMGQGLALSSTHTYAISGTISAGATYSRANGDSVTTYAAGPNIYYQTTSFVSPITASVVFETVDGTISGGFPYDTYLSLYQNSFTPATPATNFLIGDDDSGDRQYASKIRYNLTAGVTYYLVVGTYGAGMTGNYTVRASALVFPLTNNWFTVNIGGASVFSGNLFNPVGVGGSGIPNTSTPGSTNFYVESSRYPGCRTATTFIINPTTVGGSIAGSTSVCAPTNSGTLTLSGHTGSVIRWESSTDNFVSNIVQIVNTSTTYNFLNLSQTTKYRAVVKSGSCAQLYSAVATITVVTVTAPTPAGNSRCGAGTVTLTATSCAGGTINWYAGVSGGTVLATGTTYTTLSISNTTNYYVSCTLSGCTSGRVVVTATIKPLPSPPTAANVSRCDVGSVRLIATGCAGGTINWYTVAAGGTSVGSGGTYDTPVLSTTTPYYVSCTVDGCPSATRTVVQAIVNVNATMSGSQVAGDYRASISITSSANVATGVNYYAAKYIVLTTGFQAGGTEVFQAKIQGCP